MTNAMPIFINSLFPFMDGTSLDSRAKMFIEEARKSIAAAGKEMNYGDVAFAYAVSENENPNPKLAEIARWHSAQSIRRYGEAVAALERAGKLNLPAKYRKYVDLKLKKCLEEMAHANARKIKFSFVLRTAK